MNNTQNTQEKTFSITQLSIVNELCSVHGLDPSQISFDGAAPIPIFDYEAVSALSLKLTDIKTIDSEVKQRDPMQDPNESRAVCTIILPDGRTRTVEDSAAIGEEVAPGYTLETRRDADSMAQNRAVRRGIRSVGVNLWNAHRLFMKTGEVAEGTTGIDPGEKLRKQIHAAADDLGLTREEYRDLISAGYGGRTSSTELNEHEQLGFARLLRSLGRIKQSRQSESTDLNDSFKQAA